MPHILASWLLSALCLIAVAKMVDGFEVDGCGSALLAAVVVGFINGTLGAALRLVTVPLAVLTMGLFVLVVNAVVLKLTAILVPGFRIRGFGPALIGAILLSLIQIVLRYALV